MSEIWKYIPNTNRMYKVSSKGRIKSYWPPANSNKDRMEEAKILTPVDVGNGYFRVTICANGKKMNKLIHRLVAKAFIPNTKDKPCINHLDGDKSNNKVENLEWCTYSENTRHGFDNGLITGGGPSGEKSGMAKLSKKDVLDIRGHAKEKGKYYGQKELAKKYGVSKRQISCIVNRKSWKHI